MNIKKKHFHEKDNRKLYEQNNNKNEITENLIDQKFIIILIKIKT